MAAAHTHQPRHAATPTLAVWDFAGLMLTYWCSSRCAFCYVNAGPQHADRMSPELALACWHSLDRLADRHGQQMCVHLAGGEPFGDWVALVSLIRRARDAGLSRVDKVETNAFWATNDGLTRSRLELLDALGVHRLIISCDVFHQAHVPLERVRRCVRWAREIFGPGRLIVRWWDYFSEPLDTMPLSEAQRAAAYRDALHQHADRLTGRAAVALPQLLPRQPAEAFAGERCVAEVLQSRHVHIDPYGHIFPGTCAGIILGSVGRPAAADDDDGGTPTVAEVWDNLAVNWRQHPVVDAVVAGGSYELMQRVRSLGYEPLHEGYASKCHLCTHVRSFLLRRGHWPAHIGPSACYADGE